MRAPTTQTTPDPLPIPIASGTQPEHPPRAPLMLRVGVAGHRPDPKKRPDPNVAALREICRELLLRIHDTFAGVATVHHDLFAKAPPRLRLISALAEGADQWVASEAEQLGYELQAVLPFERTEYEKDFTNPDVKAEYSRFCEAATAVFELDGDRNKPGESYLAAGRVLLNQSDLLIALWDGKDPQGIGGTGQIVREAIERGIPTVWVKWDAPAEQRLLQHLNDLKDIPKPLNKEAMEELLKDKVSVLLLPPTTKQDINKSAEKNLQKAYKDYFDDCRQAWTLLGGWWNFFRDLLRLKWFYWRKQTKAEKARQANNHSGWLIKLHRLRLILPQCCVPEFIPTTRKDWLWDWTRQADGNKRSHKLPVSTFKWIKKGYLSHYAWANQLSIYYANNYRSSFAWIYLLGAVAVLLALIGKTANVPPKWEPFFITAEVIVICLIIVLTWFGRHRRWHERWIDYRTLAEQLRMVRFNCLLGGVWQQASVPSHLATYGNPTAAWMHWHARAIERAAGLPNVVVNEEYLTACKELLLEALIADQEKYHEENDERLRSVDHKLHRLGEGLFLATLAACAFHLIVALSHEWFGKAAPVWDRWLMFCAAFLPALGAAMAAIRSQGEFHRVVQRSHAMHDALVQLRETVAKFEPGSNKLHSQLLQQAVEQTTRLMYNEVLDWRIVFQDRPLVWPA